MVDGQPGLRSGATPLAVRMRPTTLAEVAGQRHLLTPGSPLVSLASDKSGERGAVSVILWGPPGTGKTTLAQAIAHSSGRRFVELSAVSAGVRDVRQVMEEARTSRDLYGLSTVLFLDEIHRFSKAQQDALLPGVENGVIILVAATTENPSFSVIAPLLSRSLLLTLETLSDEDLGVVIDRAVTDARGLADRFVLEPDARATIIRLASGDARRALTALEAASVSALSGTSASGTVNDDDDDDGVDPEAPEPDLRPVITSDTVALAVDRALLRYDRNGDEHYDVISAFIKSVRGSDVDASLHYLARMIEAGEDPRFIARRIIVLASEDIGMADPQSLVIAVAAADAVQLIGMPEGRIPLAQAVVHLATAPKSNAAYMALDAAIADVRAGKTGRVPKHLRDAHYAGAKRLGHGKGYRYPHDDTVGVVQQQYPPDELKAVRYYQPTEHGNEREVSARLGKLRRIIRGD
ncbi:MULTISPECIES: replication-associated recombination protein A [Cryobacterium]|uniref:Replication-associated recombination protein A n=1 Tax=Cryobacterium glucosi TaxID=1259175 RepID=A0ABY2IR00_9MICO|nr:MULTISPECIES: replication-associated recombination protein A [Cryobacterium]MDY7527924.1 replication-associated recombination protein A [Cryobacterium sp. 10C2]MEB0003928.1 replication-associated recombination protein A [Cryobacterium sp. RTC2.1]MEB0200135.1 replication-associated recombination protein A [Cryobacterium sp. 5I3]MEB0285314.1 replication-associated recombination protein A [Cryobacterium sp. 10S3]MEB0291714.1 replication-associated recombination protein A [Cryobacterium sp. 10C